MGIRMRQAAMQLCPFSSLINNNDQLITILGQVNSVLLWIE